MFGKRQALHGEVLERRFFGRRLIRLWTERWLDASTRPSTPSATCRCRRTSSATTRRPIAIDIRRVRARARLDRRADGRPALHAAAARRAARPRRRASPRSRCTSATARFSPSASTRRGSRLEPSATRFPRAAAADRTRQRAKAAASSPSARRRRGRSKRWRARTAARIVAGRGRDRPVHLSRLRVSSRRRAADQFPPAAVVAADAGVGVRRPRARAEPRIMRRSPSATGSTATATPC